jgi:membrane protein
MGLLYKNMNNRFKSSISLMFLLVSMSLYIKGVIANYYVINMLIEILTISVIIALGYINFKNENSRVIFSTILIDLSMLDYLVLDKNIYTIIFSLIVSLIMLLYGIKNEEHKCSLISGLILLAISIFNVLMFISNVPFLIYLFIIGFALMLAVMFLINNEKDEEINYCSNCGNKLDKKDTYCSECGEKVK